MRWRVISIHWGGHGGNGGTVLISSWKCNFGIYFDIQVYYLDPSTLLGYPINNHTFMPSIGSLCVGSFCLLIFLSYNLSPEKWRFPALKSLLLPQFWTYRHRTGFIVKWKQLLIKESLCQNFKLVNIFYKFLKLSILTKQKYAYFKKFHNIYYSIFFKWLSFIHIYIC